MHRRSLIAMPDLANRVVAQVRSRDANNEANKAINPFRGRGIL